MQTFWFRIVYFLQSHKKAVLISGATVVLLAGGLVGWLLLRPAKPVSRSEPRAEAKPKEEPKPLTKPSPLTGVEVEPALADRPVTGVVIENHPDARPQSGLSSAGVVYEALAEGGITRFLALFLEERPGVIGPVRSLRTYFVDWALEFNAAVAHVGGNADALDIVVPLGMNDLNQFVHGQYFYRTRDRHAPHNAYTTSDSLDQLQQKLGFFKPTTLVPSPRKKPSPAENPAAPVINVDYSYGGYAVQYRYDKPSNSYLRFLAGNPHVDTNNNQQIRPTNIVVQYMPTSYGFTRIGESTVMMGTPGSGKALVFRDGGVVEGTWSKAQHRDRAKLVDSSGKEIPLNPGKTWYSIVPIGKSATY